jgi:Ca2+-transporting ATPase
VTISLAIGVTAHGETAARWSDGCRSSKRSAARPSVCSDKTGTLTKNEMTVRQVWTGGRLYEFTGAGYDADR